MLDIDVSVWGIREQIDRIGQLSARARNLTRFFEREADLFRERMEEQFDTGGKHTGGSWEPLEPIYAAWKEAHYPGQPILVREGHLRESLTAAGAPGHVEEITPTSLVVGTRNPTAAMHQWGTRRMPARPIIVLEEAYKSGIADRLLRFWREGEVR